MLSLTAYDASDSSKSESSSEASGGSDEESTESPKKAVAKKGKVIVNVPADKQEDDDDDLPDHLKPLEDDQGNFSMASSMQIVSAPDVVVNVSLRHFTIDRLSQ